MLSKRVLAVAFTGVILAAGVHAAANNFMYQGVLVQSNGQAVPDGVYPFEFGLWTDAAGGTEVWHESIPGAEVSQGAFSVVLGLASPIGALFATQNNLWLEIGADADGQGMKAFGPRVPLTAVPYAIQAQDAAKLGGELPSAYVKTADVASSVAQHNSDASAHQSIRDALTTHAAAANPHPNQTIAAEKVASGFLDNARLRMGQNNGIDADTVDGAHAAALEESAEIDADIAAHNTDAGAHPDLAVNAAQITNGVLDNARLNLGHNNGIDADTVDGAHAAALEESSEIDADIAAHNIDAAAHSDIRNGVTTAVSGHNTDPAAHADIRNMMVPIGTILPIYLGLAGVPTPAQMQANGWALCNGTTPASQGIANPVITAATPDLNGQGLFLRGGTTAGIGQTDQVGSHGHTASVTDNGHAHDAGSLVANNGGAHTHYWNGFNNVGSSGKQVKSRGRIDSDPADACTNNDGTHSHTIDGSTASATTGIAVSVNSTTTGETRPKNMSVVFFIKAR